MRKDTTAMGAAANRASKIMQKSGGWLRLLREPVATARGSVTLRCGVCAGGPRGFQLASKHLDRSNSSPLRAARIQSQKPDSLLFAEIEAHRAATAESLPDRPDQQRALRAVRNGLRAALCPV